MATATLTDVEGRLGRALDEQETALAAILLDDVEAMIRHRVRSLSSLDQEILVIVEANAVTRVLRNQDGIRSQTIESISYTLDASIASGRLRILPDEWADLQPSRGYASIPMKFRRH